VVSGGCGHSSRPQLVGRKAKEKKIKKNVNNVFYVLYSEFIEKQLNNVLAMNTNILVISFFLTLSKDTWVGQINYERNVKCPKKSPRDAIYN
jgi:hypothetical protein